jgi:hypothetical protein
MRTLLIVIATVLSACATTEFRTFEARSNVFEGAGGTKVLVDGMEVWETGDPPRKFKVVGVIDDQRPGGIIPMSQLRSDILKRAREVGGQAVILLNNQSRVAGYYSTGSATATTYGSKVTATGSSVSVPVRRNTARFAVIQYVE